MPFATKVGDIMTTNVVTIDPSKSISEAVRLICEHEISGLPVVNSEGKLVGIISKTDLIACEYESLFDRVYAIDLKPILGHAGEEASLSKQPHSSANAQSDIRVETVMKTSVITATPETPLTEIAYLMKKNNIHRIIITVNDTVIGIVTSMDLLKLIAEKGYRGGGNA